MPKVLPNIQEETKIEEKIPSGPWKVILWDDDEHTYDYVIEMLMEVCKMPVDQAYYHAWEVDTAKKTVVFTGELEHAEYIHGRIITYGPDPRISNCKGSMTATLEK